MKHKLRILPIVVLGISMSLVSCAHSDDPSQVVIQAFDVQYKGVDQVDWKMIEKGQCEATFNKDGKKHSAFYTSQGKWIETDCKIEVEELPELVFSTMDQRINDYTLTSLHRSMTPDGDVFVIDMEVDGESRKLIIDEEGVVVKDEIGPLR